MLQKKKNQNISADLKNVWTDMHVFLMETLFWSVKFTEWAEHFDPWTAKTVQSQENCKS